MEERGEEVVAYHLCTEACGRCMCVAPRGCGKGREGLGRAGKDWARLGKAFCLSVVSQEPLLTGGEGGGDEAAEQTHLHH